MYFVCIMYGQNMPEFLKIDTDIKIKFLKEFPPTKKINPIHYIDDTLYIILVCIKKKMWYDCQ